MTKPSSRAPIDPAQRERLIAAARSAASRAYAPYSRFHVGAAVLGESGRIYRGANIENASYGLSECAERIALAAARVGGEESPVALAVACVDAPEGSPLEGRLPCGACRQWIQELAPDAQIIVAGEEHDFSIGDLMPHAFALKP
jgi:cytidine deaminase